MSNLTVLTGIWQDHSHTGWSSYTVTVDVQTASYIISALAAFITIIGGRFWVIISFMIHQLRSSPKAKDGVHHQHQLVYRNASSQLGAIWFVTAIAFSWKGRAQHNWRRMIAFLLPPLLCFLAFTAASVLSARVTSPSYVASRVLLQDENCGYIEWSTDAWTEGLFQGASWLTSNAITAKNYARACYGSGTQGIANCRVFPSQRLPYTVDTNAPCPFRGSRCVLGETGATKMSSPWLDSHFHFGINAPRNDRVEYRKSSVCTVLSIDDLIEIVPQQQGNLYQFHLSEPETRKGRSNYTYQVSDSVQNSAIGYTIMPQISIYNDPHGDPSWHPISDLNRTDADVSIFFMAQNSIAYMKPVDDPFYAAHRTYYQSHTGQTFYTSDNLVRVLGCTDQFQIRDPNSSRTTEMTSSLSVLYQTYSIGLSPVQVATAWRLLQPVEDSIMFSAVSGLGSAALKAQDTVFILVSPGLPDDQWRLEVKSWFETTLAGVQASVLRFVSKNISGIAPNGRLSLPSTSPDTVAMCKGQIIRNIGAYQSFSLLAISLIVLFGLLITVLSAFIEELVAAGRKRWRKTTMYKTERWQADSMLQQQRLAFQALHIGEWSKKDSNVPVTASGEKFAWPSSENDICLGQDQESN